MVVEKVKKSPEEAFKWLKKSAEAGNAYGQFLTGLAYSRGDGTEKSVTEAESWYKKAAAQNELRALHNLGLIYLNTDSKEKQEEGLKLLEEAANQKSETSAFAAGSIYASGLKTISKDSSKARKYLEISSDLGNAQASVNLGVLYANGDGVPKD